METLKLNSHVIINNRDDFINNYGLRSYNLWKLIKGMDLLDYSVPVATLISASLSRELQFKIKEDDLYESEVYNLASNNLVQKYHEYLLNNYPELLSIAKEVNNGADPIIRGTSCGEGYNNLSFAGVCQSYIPKNILDDRTNVYNGLARVLSSVFSPYAQYYFNIHNVPPSGKDVGIIMMGMIDKPLFHATAYVYQSEIRIKYFFTPQTGAIYSGGGDVIINTDNEDFVLAKEFSNYCKIWKKTVKVLRNLPILLQEEFFPLDVEFLISEELDGLKINIVQVRRLSPPHLENYTQNLKHSDSISFSNNAIIIPEHYLYHSFGCYSGQVNYNSKNVISDGHYANQIFVVKHDNGNGLFNFVSSLPHNGKKNGLIITHPKNRTHDHLQYSIFEDRRFSFILHTEESNANMLKDKMIITMTSNGKKASLENSKEINFDGIRVNFINGNPEIPKQKKVSAVFLVGFIDGLLMAARNERGWDIPGGHVETYDKDLFDALQRESKEEAGVIVNSAVAFATMQFKDRNDIIVFYASKDCILQSFLPKDDALERELMLVSDFLPVYNWKKDIMEILINKALSILK